MRFDRTDVFAGCCVAALAASPASGADFGFGPARELDPTAAGVDDFDDFTVHVATDDEGRWVAVWEFEAIGEAEDVYGIDLDTAVSRSLDGGASWSEAVPLNTNADSDAGDDYVPQVAAGGSGLWIAAWFSSDSLGDTIDTDRDVLYARSSDDGATWGDPAALNANAADDDGDDTNPRIATAGDATWVAIWSSNDSLGDTIDTDRDILVARSPDYGSTWLQPVALDPGADEDLGTDQGPALATDGLGAWVAAWHVSGPGHATGPDTDILVSRSTNGGLGWSSPVRIDPDAATDVGNDFNVSLAADGMGGWVMVWYSDDPRGAAGLGTDDDILFARSTDHGASWSPPAPLNTNAASDARNDIDPEVTTDGNGNWAVVWYADSPRDVYFAHSSDGGASWSDPALLAPAYTASGRRGDRPEVAADSSGRFVAVWEGGSGEAEDDIFVVVPEPAAGLACGSALAALAAAGARRAGRRSASMAARAGATASQPR